MKTFQEQFNKLTEVYIANKIEPYKNCACWIGNLLGSGSWSLCRTFVNNKIVKSNLFSGQEIDFEGYTLQEIMRMEENFLTVLMNNCPPSPFSSILNCSISRTRDINSPKYEPAIFLAFSSTMDMLRDIHISRGENVDEYIVRKRQLEIN